MRNLRRELRRSCAGLALTAGSLRGASAMETSLAQQGNRVWLARNTPSRASSGLWGSELRCVPRATGSMLEGVTIAVESVPARLPTIVKAVQMSSASLLVKRRERMFEVI